MKIRSHILKGILIVFILSCTGLYGQNKEEKLVSDTISKIQNHKVNPNEKGSGINQDEKFSQKSIPELIIMLDSSNDKNELKKIAKELGDREIKGEVVLTTSDKKIIDEKAAYYIQLSKMKNANAYEEASGQIQRLWRLAVPVLLDSLESNNIAVAEFSAKSLILMRDEQIIKSIINKAKSTQDQQKKDVFAFTLSKMTEERKSFIPDRNCMNKEESEKLFKRFVKPALKKISKK